MHLFRRSAAFLIPLLAIISVICTGEAWAQSALGVGVRIKQEFFTPLVPKTMALKKCFKMDPSGGVDDGDMRAKRTHWCAFFVGTDSSSRSGKANRNPDAQ